MGILTGALGALYNRAIVASVRVAEDLDRWPAGTVGALVGCVVGILVWFAPGVVGGGDDLTQDVLAGRVAIGALPLLFVVRFVLGPVSYGAGTPGGLFAPLLVIGAQIGFGCGWLAQRAFPELAPSPILFAIAGMAAFFTATVRSTLTGIVLVGEMTGTFSHALPMLGRERGRARGFGAAPQRADLRHAARATGRAGVGQRDPRRSGFVGRRTSGTPPLTAGRSSRSARRR